jgi:hypothetical protein
MDFKNESFVLAPVSGGLDRFDVTASGVGTGRSVIVAAGDISDVVRAVTRSLGDEPVVGLRFDKPGHVVVRPNRAALPIRNRIVQVEAPLRFDGHDVRAILDLIAENEPDIVVLSGRASTSDNDFQWAAAIADELDPPTILALSTERYSRIGRVPADLGTPREVNVYAAVRESRYRSVPGLNLYAATGVPITNDAPLASQANLRFNVTSDVLPGLTDALAGVARDDDGGVSRQPPSAGIEVPQRQSRYVNTLVHRHGDGTVVPPLHALAEDTDYRLGIGIGPELPDSLLAGKDATFPDEIFTDFRGRRVTIYVQPTTGADRKSEQANLYLPGVGAAFTCPTADEQPPNTDWDTFSHTTCQKNHSDLAEFTIPRLRAGETISVEALLYIGAAVLHRQQIELSTDPSRGCTAEPTFRLLDTFDTLPDLTDRVVSIVEGADHLTINGVNQGVFTYTISDPQWSMAAFRFRTALIDLYFEKRGDTKSGYAAKYPIGRTSQAVFERLFSELAYTGRNLFNSVFPGPDNSGLAPMLRGEAEARDSLVVIQVARTIQRQFALPWQIVYDLPLSQAVDKPQICESLKQFGPKGQDWPPPTMCPYADEHPTAPDMAVLCPWGFWGLAHLLEVPAGNKTMKNLVADTAASNEILAAAGAGLDTADLDAHFNELHKSVPGFPGNRLSEAKALYKALAAPTDVVYVLCHGTALSGVGEGTALLFADEQFTSYGVGEWSRDAWGGQSHWKDRRPLVILNACRSAEIVQSTLSDFVKMFALAGAAGVVGTETYIDQPTASIAMQHFLKEFTGNATASEALRSARWRLLGLGSLLGLTYSPYCSATLRMRPAQN